VRISTRLDHAFSFLINPHETVVVSGFWRSGTTWLQQSLAALLNAKTVYEPLRPTVAAMKEIYSYSGLSAKDAAFLELYMPYCRDRTLDGHPLYRFFDRALRSDLPGGAIRGVREGVTESFRRRVVAKFIRGHFCLRAAQNTFMMPVIHIYRDPRAIIASIKGTEWKRLFDPLCLREQLLELQDGRTDFFSNWADEILECDKKGEVARIAAYWALTEKFVQLSYADDNPRPPVVFVSYEELCQEREEKLLQILQQLGIRHRPLKNSRVLDTDSATTTRQRRGVAVEDRIAGWKTVLPHSEVALVESIVQRFGLGDRLMSG
jgi:hypothetical protein